MASLLAEIPYSNLHLPATVALAALALIGYMASYARSGKAEFTVIDAVIVAVLAAIVGATTIPLLEMTNRRAKAAALLQNLHTLRSQIELYKLGHGGEPPVLYQGSFPQLLRATNAEGVPGEPGTEYPCGPYLRSGMPLNPITGRSIVTATDAFPPTAPSKNCGWLYHQATGQIAADLAGYLDQ